VPEGRPVYDLQERFSLAYLHHRFAIQAVQQLVGGQYQSSALAGDGQLPTDWVPAPAQRAALQALLAQLDPDVLDIPDRILGDLPGPPGELRPTREAFADEAGATFSPLAAARALSTLVIRPLLDPARAARLTLGAGPASLGLGEVLETLSSSVWDERRPATLMRSRIRHATQRVELDALMDLARGDRATPEVRAIVTGELSRLLRLLSGRRGWDVEDEASLRLAERDIGQFLADPAARTAHPAAPVPPGRPIGQP